MEVGDNDNNDLFSNVGVDNNNNNNNNNNVEFEKKDEEEETIPPLHDVVNPLLKLTAIGRSPDSLKREEEEQQPQLQQPEGVHDNVVIAVEKVEPAHQKQEQYSYQDRIDGFSVSIIDAITSSQKKDGKKFTAYVVEIIADKSKYRVVQRYSDFYACHQRIKKQFDQTGSVDLPPLPILPPKEFFKNDDPDFIQTRRNELETYLQLLAVHPFISKGKDPKKLAQSLMSILPGSLQAHHCYQLLDELKDAIQTILDESIEDPDLVIFDTNRAALQLCYTLEKILTHGLRGSTAIFSKKYFWILFEKLPRNQHIDSERATMTVDTILSLSQEEGKNNLARGRIFLRLALNNHSISQYLKSLLFNQQILNDLYEDQALVHNEEHKSILLLLLDMLDQTQFSLWVKDKALGDANYYDKAIKELDAKPKPPPVKKEVISVAPPKTPERTIKKRVIDEAQLSPKVGEQMQSSLWSIISMSLINEEKQQNIYHELCNKSTDFDAQIEADIHRVLTKVSFNNGDGPQLLKRVVTAFSLFSPDLGYSQEVSLVAAILLLQLEEEGAFWVMVWLSKKYSYEGKHLFSQGSDFIHLSTFCLERLLSANHPEIFNHFESVGFKLSLVLSDWFSTLFVYSAPVSTVFRFWDVLFLEDRDYIFRIAVSVLRLSKDKILKENNLEEIVSLLKERLKVLSADAILKDAEELHYPQDIISVYYNDFLAAFPV